MEPARLSRPKVGLSPNTPQKDEGTRIEPLVSDPSEKAPRPAATAAAEPPDDPPALWVRSRGLCTSPKWAFSVVKP